MFVEFCNRGSKDSGVSHDQIIQFSTPRMFQLVCVNRNTYCQLQGKFYSSCRLDEKFCGPTRNPALPACRKTETSFATYITQTTVSLALPFCILVKHEFLWSLSVNAIIGIFSILNLIIVSYSHDWTFPLEGTFEGRKSYEPRLVDPCAGRRASFRKIPELGTETQWYCGVRCPAYVRWKRRVARDTETRSANSGRKTRETDTSLVISPAVRKGEMYVNWRSSGNGLPTPATSNTLGE